MIKTRYSIKISVSRDKAGIPTLPFLWFPSFLCDTNRVYECELSTLVLPKGKTSDCGLSVPFLQKLQEKQAKKRVSY